MKKLYKKPQILFESFILNQSVAQFCSSVPGGNTIGRANHWDIYKCGWDLDGDVLWLETTSVCNIPYGKDDLTPEGMCYNNPEGGNTVFAS